MAARKRPKSTLARLEEFALSLPEAWADTPWGDHVVKVGKKIFVFLGSESSERPGFTVKLPESRDHGLSFEGAILPGYGLGKHGWVTIYLEGVPGSMIRLGVGVPGSDQKFDIHQSSFDVDERSIGYGVRVMVHTALAALSAGAF